MICTNTVDLGFSRPLSTLWEMDWVGGGRAAGERPDWGGDVPAEMGGVWPSRTSTSVLSGAQIRGTRGRSDGSGSTHLAPPGPFYRGGEASCLEEWARGR